MVVGYMLWSYVHPCKFDLGPLDIDLEILLSNIFINAFMGYS